MSDSGPLPTPDKLGKYEQVLPGAAERILAMVERQSAHRIELEKTTVTRQLQESSRGQFCAFGLAIFFGAMAVVAAVYGHDTVGGILGGSTVLGLASTFVIGKQKQAKNLTQHHLPAATTQAGREEE